MEGLRPPGLQHQVTVVPPLRGYGRLVRTLSRLLPLLLVLSLLAGLLLRYTSSRPEPAGLMAMLGCLCWLLGLPLAEPVQEMLQRLDLHRRHAVRQLATRLRLLLVLAVSAVALALALLPLHFAYDQAQDLFTVQTLNVEPVVFRSGFFLLLIHILAAPAYILLSTGLLRLLRGWLPAYLAAMLWLATGSLACLVSYSLALPGIWPVSLGQLSNWTLEFMYANRQLASPYIQQLVEPLLLRLLLLYGLGLGLCWLGIAGTGRAWQRLRPLWLACSAGILASGLRSAALTWRWTGEVLPLSPADWWSLLISGLLACWTVWLLQVLVLPAERLRHSFRRDLPWLLLLPVALLAITAPSVLAGDAGHSTRVAGMLLLLPRLLLGIVLPLQASQLGSSVLQGLALLAIAGLLLLPLPSQSSLLEVLDTMRPGFSLPLPAAEQLRIWACLLVLLLLAWPGLLQRVARLLPQRRGYRIQV